MDVFVCAWLHVHTHVYLLTCMWRPEESVSFSITLCLNFLEIVSR